MNFNNKNVVITGGTSGIGFATAQAFINAGATVWITSRSAANLEKASATINSSNLKTVVSDTATLAGIALLEEAIAASNTTIDVLYLNAGIAVFTPIAQVTEADFDAQFNTNVKGSFFTLQKLLPYINNGASVVFTSSTVATTTTLGGSVYSATKGALNKIAQIAANELAERKIRVNIVSPGPTATPGLDGAVPEEGKAGLAAATSLQRLGTPEEIANSVLFLASDNASFINGAELLVDGGFVNYMLK